MSRSRNDNVAEVRPHSRETKHGRHLAVRVSTRCQDRRQQPTHNTNAHFHAAPAPSAPAHRRLDSTSGPPPCTPYRLLIQDGRGSGDFFLRFGAFRAHLTTPALPQYDFGPYQINESEVFAKTLLSIAFVNLKPVVPGHVLITPRRVVRRLADLDQNELADMWVRACAKTGVKFLSESAKTCERGVGRQLSSHCAHAPLRRSRSGSAQG